MSKLKIARFDPLGGLPAAKAKSQIPDWWVKQLELDETITPALMDRDVLIHDRRVDDEDAARKVIESEHTAGEKALAVSFYTERVDTREGKSLRKKIDRINRQVETLLGNAFKSLKAGKSPRVACKKCRSSLNREFIRQVECPMCKDEMMSSQRKVKLAALKSEIEAVQKELEGHPAVPRKSGPVAWLVGGWVRSE